MQTPLRLCSHSFASRPVTTNTGHASWKLFRLRPPAAKPRSSAGSVTSSTYFRVVKAWSDSRRGVCKQIAFYGSTPAYRPVLEMHGWGGLQNELNALSKQGQWDKMGELVDDKILEQFAVVGTPDEVIPKFKARFGDVVDRTTLGFAAPKASTKELIAQLHG